MGRAEPPYACLVDHRSSKAVAAAAVVVLITLGTVTLTAGPAAGQAAGGPELRVHRVLKPKSLRDFLRRGERAVVSCDADCNVVMRLVARRRVARVLGRTRSRVIARGSAPIAGGFRGIVAARPRGVVAKRLRAGALPRGFRITIRFRAFAVR